MIDVRPPVQRGDEKSQARPDPAATTNQNGPDAGAKQSQVQGPGIAAANRKHLHREKPAFRAETDLLQACAESVNELRQMKSPSIALQSVRGQGMLCGAQSGERGRT